MPHFNQDEVFVKQPVGKGETNLARHIDDMHGFVKRRAGESESAEKNIVSAKKTGPIVAQQRGVPSKDPSCGVAAHVHNILAYPEAWVDSHRSGFKLSWM